VRFAPTYKLLKGLILVDVGSLRVSTLHQRKR